MTRLAIGLTLSAGLAFEPYTIIGPGTFSYANPGVLEAVASRRVQAAWGQLDKDWTQYDTLIAPADCGLLGRDGWLIADGRIVRVLVVDCEAESDKGTMAKRHLLADVNVESLVHLKGWLILK